MAKIEQLVCDSCQMPGNTINPVQQLHITVSNGTPDGATLLVVADTHLKQRCLRRLTNINEKGWANILQAKVNAETPAKAGE